MSDDSTDGQTEGAAHRANAVSISNSVWDLFVRADLTDGEADDLLRRCYAGAFHWARASGRAPHNDARATYLVAKAHLKVAERLDDAEQTGHAQVGLYHARRCLAATEARGLVDFDLAYAHEVMARALAATGDVDGARSHWETAQGVPIALDEDRALVHADLAVAPF